MNQIIFLLSMMLFCSQGALAYCAKDLKTATRLLEEVNGEFQKKKSRLKNILPKTKLSITPEDFAPSPWFAEQRQAIEALEPSAAQSPIANITTCAKTINAMEKAVSVYVKFMRSIK